MIAREQPGRIAIERALCAVLIGRERELSLLEDTLLASLRGEGQVAVVAGDAGIGKTRLVSEVSRRAAKVGCTVVAGSCSEAELALPYLPFVEALGNFLAKADLSELRLRLGPSCRELAQVFPQLGGDRASNAAGDPSQAKLRLFEAILDLLRIPAADHGLLVVLEDLQWADASACELLDYLTRRLGNSRIMVLATYRREELNRQHPLVATIQRWRRSGLASVVELEPMSAEGVAGMVRAIFDGEEVNDEFRDFMHSRTEGNPFVLEEMLKTALDRRDIFFRPETGRWDRKALTDLQLPTTVRDMILLRVERLTDTEAEILRAAAVLGRSFDHSIAMTVAGRDQSTIEGAIRAATRQQLLEEDPGSPGRYRFRHALTQEAIYQDLSIPERERLHLAAAEALNARPGAGAADRAYHLMAANRWEEAKLVCLNAAEEAKRIRGYREAAALYERLMPHLSNSVERGRVRCLVGDARFNAGEYGEALPLLQEGVRVLEEHDEQREAAHYRLILGRCHWERSSPGLARVEFERVRTMLEPKGPSEDLADAYVNLARLAAMDLKSQEVLALVERGIAVAIQANADAPRIWAYQYRGSTLADLGQTDQGLKDLDRSYHEAVEHNLDWIASGALFNGIEAREATFRGQEALAQIELLRERGGLDRMLAGVQECVIRQDLGQPGRARQAGEEALALARQAEASTWVARIKSVLAVAYSSLGRSAEAHELLGRQPSEVNREDARLFVEAKLRVFLDEGGIDEAVQQARSALADLLQVPPLVFYMWLIDRATEVFIRAGMQIEAKQLLEKARRAPVQPDNPYLARIEGRWAFMNGDLNAAHDRLRAATDFFARVSYRDDEWRTRRALAEVKARLSDRAGAESDLRAVVTGAGANGHVTEEAAARKQLRELGVEVASAVSAPPMSAGAVRQIEERLVTIMFVDVRGYTAFASQTAPSDLADRVATFYRWTEQEIVRHHGLVAQYGGDAVMATFNVSGVHLDHCLHALQAALAIRDKAAYNGLPVGVGIAVGPAVVGQLSQGSPITAVGETPNLAARLQSGALAGEIVLSGESFRRVRDWLHSQQLEARGATLSLKGFESVVPAFVLPSRPSIQTR